MKLVRMVLASLALVATAAPLPAQQYFGQNHVLYGRFDWKVIETEHFQVHYYPSIAEAAVLAAQMAERAYARLSPIIGHEFREKKPIVLFASRMDFGQNNIFGDPGEGTLGVTDFLRQRNMVFFTGELRDFERVLMHEMVHVFQYDVFSRGHAGSNFQLLAHVAPPLWFMEGMAEYLTTGPDDPATNAIMRDAALNGKIPSIEEMTSRPDLYFPYRYGQSFWEFIGRRWGDRMIGDIMNASASVGVERAFRRQLGTGLEDLGEEWKEAIQDEFLPAIAERDRARSFSDPVLDKRRTGGAAPVYVAPSLSPDGTQIAYLSTGSYLRAEVFLDLYLANVETGRRDKRLTRSVFNPETEELRVLSSQAAFSPDGRYLAYTAQRRGRDALFLLDVRENVVVRRYDTELESMLGPSFSPDGDRIAFSGARGGITDLYIIDVNGGGLRRLTSDAFGDVQPSWSPDGRSIAYASERGPQSDFNLLRFGPRQISVYDLETRTVQVLPGQAGMNSNPQWAPDGRSIAYVSDRTGTHNIFLYDLDERTHYQLTDVFGSVLSLTPQSPAISWARDADLLAFTFYEEGQYTVRSINRPRTLKREPFSLPETVTDAVRASALPRPLVDTLYVFAFGNLIPMTVPSSGGRGNSGGLGSVNATTTPPLTVAAMLDSASLALPDTATFRYTSYRPNLSPELVSRPVIGYADDNFGRGVFGGTSILLSDMLGNHRLGVAAAINGRLSESVMYGSYSNLSRRLQYTVGIQQMPFFLLTDATLEPPASDGDSHYWLDRQKVSRYVFRDGFANAFYPLNRFSRTEAGITFSQIDVTDLHISREIDPNRGVASGFTMDSVTGRGSTTLASPYLAYVQDNALWGMVGPIMGHRLRAQYRLTTGDWSWHEVLVDARRYDPILFNYLTLSTRFVANVRAGRDENRFPQTLGRPGYIRGYDRESYYNSPCALGLPIADEDATPDCGTVDELIGTRVAFANAELRFPLVRRLELGTLPIGLPPVEGAVFYDAGVAWSAGQTVALSRTSNDNANRRHLLTSYGFSIRTNLFGLAIMRWDYAIPLGRPDRSGYWRWSVGPAF